MREKNIPRWLLPVLVVIFLAAIFALLFARRLGASTPSVEQSSSIEVILHGEINPDRQIPTQPRDPCSLLKSEEIEEALGFQIGESYFEAVDNSIGEMVCTFPGTNGDTLPVVLLVAVYTEGMDPYLIENGYSVDYLFAGRNVSDRYTKPVPDIGDDAFWGGTGTELWNGLHVRIWDVYFQIDVSSGDEENDLAVAQNLLLIAMNRLFNE